MNFPGGEHSGGEIPDGETSWGEITEGVNHPGDESSVGINIFL